MFCRNCGTPSDENAQFCIRCGASLKDEPVAAGTSQAPPPFSEAPPPPPPPGAAWNVPAGYEPKQKLVAALLAFLLGWIGVHRFYLGYNTIGAIQLGLGLLGMATCGITTFAAWVWAIVDGVMILTGSIQTDARGVPLRD